MLRDMFPQIDIWANKIANGIGWLLLQGDQQKEINRLTQGGTKLTEEQIEVERKRLEQLKEIPEIIETEVTTKFDAAAFAEHLDYLDAMKELTITPKVDKPAAATAKTELLSYFVNGEQRWMEVEVAPVVTPGKLEEVSKSVEAELGLKRYEIEIEANSENLKTQAALIEKSLEFKAQVDIAEFEAAAKTVEALSSSISAALSSSAEVAGSLLSSLGEVSSGSSRSYYLQSLLDDEMRLRQEALDLQRDLNQAQIDYMNAKTRAINQGDAQIKITADGMEPEIEAFMWRILDKIQLRAAAEQAEFLLGLPA
jgi:hypothetical protein